jgi:hypothetical protein
MNIERLSIFFPDSRERPLAVLLSAAFPLEPTPGDMERRLHGLAAPRRASPEPWVNLPA